MLGQVKPGENLIRVPMTFHFMRGFGSCVIDFHRAVGVNSCDDYVYSLVCLLTILVF